MQSETVTLSNGTVLDINLDTTDHGKEVVTIDCFVSDSKRHGGAVLHIHN